MENKCSLRNGNKKAYQKLTRNARIESMLKCYEMVAMSSIPPTHVSFCTKIKKIDTFSNRKKKISQIE